MGGTDKATNVKGQQGKSKECVSEATISKLLNDFNCASLLTQQPGAKDQMAGRKEDLHPNYEEVVSSLKHLHLKRPANKKTRRREKKNLERRAKVVTTDKYNLSVAAIHTQRPIVWPGKLNCLSRGTDPDTILQPSRLSVPVKTNQQLCTSSIHISSSEEKSRIAASLSKHNMPFFSDLKESDTSTHMSFSKLCNQQLKDSKVGIVTTCKNSFISSPSAQSNPTLIKNNCNCCLNNRPSSTCQQNFSCLSKNRNESTSRSAFSQYQSYESSDSTSSHNGQVPCFQKNTCQICKDQKRQSSDSTSCSYLTGSSQNSVNNLTEPTSSSINQSSGATSANGSLPPERSCSEEMRMEESNVNELASYFEDLLHIPRKMSVMAEMMYA